MRDIKCYIQTVAFFAVTLGCIVSCRRSPCDGMRVRLDAHRIAQRAITQLDVNGDGKLDDAELDKCPGLKAVASRIDHDITADDIAKRVNQWEESRLGRMRIICIVMHNGKPLADARVKFVPESFLGREAMAAFGETDQKGLATISVRTDPNDPLGVPPGFYRVEITKSGVHIPAKYNIETVFGTEVALDIEGIQDVLKFDMTY